jgi:hypothetical protein
MKSAVVFFVTIGLLGLALGGGHAASHLAVSHIAAQGFAVAIR